MTLATSVKEPGAGGRISFQPFHRLAKNTEAGPAKYVMLSGKQDELLFRRIVPDVC